MFYYPRIVDNVRDGALSHCLINNIEHIYYIYVNKKVEIDNLNMFTFTM